MPIPTDGSASPAHARIDLHTLDIDQRVWKIRFTGELFVEYDAYLARLDLYRQRMWKCSISGKTCLTYEEAQVQEERTQQQLDSFPKEFTKLLCESVQFAQKTLSDITKLVAQEIKNQTAKNQGKPLGRLRAPTHSVIRLKVKQLAEKRRSIWILRDGVAAQFGISEEMPPEIKELLKPKKSKSKKRTRDDDDTSTGGDGKYPREDQLVPPKLDDNGNPISFPEFHYIAEFSPSEYTDLLTVWYFCSCFSGLLRLTRFPVSYLEEALLFDSRNVLVDEIFIAFLDALREVHYDSDDEDCIFPKSCLKHFKPSLLGEFIDYRQQQDGVERFSRNIRKSLSNVYLFYRLDVETKLRLLTFLIDQILSSAAAREAIKEKLANQVEVSRRKKEREEKLNERLQPQRDEIKELREQVAQLKEEMESKEPNNENSNVNSNRGSRAQSQSVELGGVNERIKEIRDHIRQVKMDEEKKFEETHCLEMDEQLIRFQDLGSDRLFRRYYWTKESSGRIFIQTHVARENAVVELPMEVDEKEREQPEKKRRRIDSLSEVTTALPQDPWTKPAETFEWMYLERTSQLDSLFNVLDERGVREKKLIENLSVRRKAIEATMRENGNDDGHAEQNLRRSSRKATQTKLHGFKKYKNLFKR